MNVKTLAGVARIVGIISPQIGEKACRSHFFSWFVGITHEISKAIKFWITLDSRGYFLAMKRATKEGVAKRREKPLVQAVKNLTSMQTNLIDFQSKSLF